MYRTVTGIFWLLAAMPATAMELGDWRLNLFASQALAHSDNNNFLGETDDDLSADNSELGATIFGPLAKGLSTGIQILSRRAGENDDGNVRLDYGFLAYDAIADLDHQLTLKGGRVQYPYGLYNETRDVAFTRSGIFMPQSIYPDRIRNTRFSINGGEIGWQRFLDFDSLALRLFYGELSVDNDEVKDFAPGGFIEQLDEKETIGFRMEYSINEGEIRMLLGGATNEFAFDEISIQFIDALPVDGRLRAKLWYASVEYNTENWTFSAEYQPLQLDFDTSEFNLPPSFPVLGSFDLTVNTLGYYGQALYRFHPAWSAMLRYDVYYLDKDDKDGDFLQEGLFQLFGIPSEIANAKDVTLGLTWNPDYHWMVRFEWHHVRGLAWITARDNPSISPPVTQKLHNEWNLVALQVAFRY